jgi:hypothetical protein
MRPILNKKQFNPRTTLPACRSLAVIGLLVLACSLAMAETGHVTYVPMTLRTAPRHIRTGVCLQVEERQYPQSPWWEAANSDSDAAERAFKAVLVAIKRQDRDALLRLSHPTLGRDPKEFDLQSDAFFAQFATFQLVAVPRAYELDGLVAFYAKIRSSSPEESGFAPFVFAVEADGTFGFLPYRTEKLAFQLLNDWFQDPWGPAKTDRPAYCSDDEIKHATHSISLGSSSGSSHPSRLFLTGAPLDTRGDLARIAAQIKTTVEEMKAALAARKLDDFAQHLIPEDGKKLKEWFASAKPAEIAGYSAAFANQQPFFFFDASPLFVVFTKTSPKSVEVMYLTLGPRNSLLWTNSSYITIADGVFKQGPLEKSALLDQPFSNIAIK